ncbi:MAG: adenylate/guanylate cyclase domain-containing protein [Desulfomonilaceae bacterium]
MTYNDKTSTDINRLNLLPLISIFSSIIGAVLLFAWFAQVQQGLSAGFNAPALGDWITFIVTLIVTVSIGYVTSKMQLRSLLRELKGAMSGLQQDGPQFAQDPNLANITGKLLNVPFRFALKTLWLWIGAGVFFTVAPYIIPDYFPWHKPKAFTIAIWTVFVAAPVSVIFSYFSSEWWLRSTLEKMLPQSAMDIRPNSIRINVLPKMLAVCLPIGIMPAIVIGSVTVHRIVEIQAGYLSINTFLAQMPVAIGFLVTIAVSLAVCLSIFLARSVSEPLRKIGSAMDMVRKGDLGAKIQVVSNDEIGIVGEGFNRMVEGLKERDYIRDTFGSYISESVVKQILESPDGVKVGGELREITILVSDLRGFTRMADSLDPRRVIKILNRYFERMTEVIARYQGTIIEFTGDGLLVFFGAPNPISDHAKVAVACAQDMQKDLKKLNKENILAGEPELNMGIAINSGPVVVGNIGSEKRKKYGAVGTPINVAFRVQSLTGSGEILLTPAVYERVDGSQDLGPSRECQIKGFDDPITVRPVLVRTTPPDPGDYR